MKYLMQFGIIAVFYYIGEVLNYIIDLPIPSTIYGLALLFIALCAGVIKLDQVEDAATALLSMMPIMFAPAGVGMLTILGVLKESGIAIVITSILTTFTTLFVTGHTCQLLIKLRDTRKGVRK